MVLEGDVVREPRVTVMYEGWQVWDGVYGPVAVGGVVTATVEFVLRSRPVPTAAGVHPSMRHLGANRYGVTATVRDVGEAVVLDLGPLRVLSWVRPGEAPTGFEAGRAVAAEIGLGLNPWDDTPWTLRAVAEHGAAARLQVEGITRHGPGPDDVTDLSTATTDTVDSASQYCLLDCRILECPD